MEPIQNIDERVQCIIAMLLMCYTLDGARPYVCVLLALVFLGLYFCERVLSLWMRVRELERDVRRRDIVNSELRGSNKSLRMGYTNKVLVCSQYVEARPLTCDVGTQTCEEMIMLAPIRRVQYQVVPIDLHVVIITVLNVAAAMLIDRLLFV